MHNYRNYLLIVLTAIFASNYLDRFAFGILLQNIKTDLALSDTQLGFLGGIAFALFYAVMGIPLARWADRGNRVTIIALTAALWSGAVALCGMATSFMQLLFARAVVAVGEAGCQPPAVSLISDYFSRAERPRAIARYQLGNPLALATATVLAGWLNEFVGWRMTLVILGLPGLAVSALAWFTLREPRLNAAVTKPVESVVPIASLVPQPSLTEVLTALWCNRAFRHLLFCYSLGAFFAYGILQWQPAFFMRSYGLSTGELGTWLAVIATIAGLSGTYLGGELASRYAPNNERLQLGVLAVLYACFAVIKASVYLAPNYYVAFGLLALAMLGGAATNGPLLAATQTLVPPHMRAMSIALLLFFSNLIGMGFGPLAAGVISDALRPAFGEESLRYALLILCPGYLWAAWHLWRASRSAGAAAREAGKGITGEQEVRNEPG